MNEFDEEKKEDAYKSTSPNTEATNVNVNNSQYDSDTEANTTYHYSYKSTDSTQQSNRTNYNTAESSYYTPPQSDYSSVFNGQSYAHEEDNNKSKTVEYDEFGNPVPRKKNKTVLAIVIVLVICVIAAIIGVTVSALDSGSNKPQENTSSGNSSAEVKTEAQGDVATTDNDGNYTVAGIAEQCIDSCVGITVYTQASSYGNFYSYGYNSDSQSGNGQQQRSGEGSGIIMLESNGKTYILTCAHVISDGSSFTITLNDGTEYDASMVGYDSQTDIGVLSINATGLKVASFADSSSTVLGEQVVAIGCPGGLQFMNSITSGYVSALARPISSTIGYDTDCIQIDAAINPGNSGGALFNMQGQVIGVNSSKIAATEYEGIGFAVPSNTAIETANSLIRVGYVEGRAKVGITYKNIETYQNSAAIIKALEELGFENAKGTMVINEVSADSDLANKNIREYDMIVAINGNTMTSTDVLTSVLSESHPGDTIKLTIARIENNNIDTFEVDCKLIESKGN